MKGNSIMRASISGVDQLSDTSFVDNTGGTMLGPLFLYSHPVHDYDAATKQYVDNVINSMDVSSLGDIIIPIESLPGFLGDATAPVGSNVINLREIIYDVDISKFYFKYKIDEKGRFTEVYNLTYGDIPNYPWSKITNKPTDAAGYGITNYIPTDAEITVTNYITAHSDPISDEDLATKQYVDNASDSASDRIMPAGLIILTGYTELTRYDIRAIAGGASGFIGKTSYPRIYNAIKTEYIPNIELYDQYYLSLLEVYVTY